MVIRELLKKADKMLSEKGIEDSFNEAAVLLAYAYNNTKTYLFTHLDEETDAKAETVFEGYIEKRSRRVPVAYIMGKAWFMSMELFVDESTLIPRPETEELVEETLKIIKDKSTGILNVLDICTGSGCIGLAIANYDKRVNAVLSDLNPACVAVAKKNMQKHNLANRISVIESDLYKEVPGIKFDVITTNPPYIPSVEIKGLEDDVRLYEPTAALDGGPDGLDFYKKIISGAPEFLNPEGFLVLEIGIGQSESVKDILVKNKFNIMSIINDIAGIPRIVIANLSRGNIA